MRLSTGALLLCALLVTGCGHQETVVDQRDAIIESNSVDNFNEGAAVGGYLMGRGVGDGSTGLLWGMAMGSAAADGCRVKVVVRYRDDDNTLTTHSVTLRAPRSACKLAPGTTVTVDHLTTSFYDSDNKLTGTSESYRWRY